MLKQDSNNKDNNTNFYLNRLTPSQQQNNSRQPILDLPTSTNFLNSNDNNHKSQLFKKNGLDEDLEDDDDNSSRSDDNDSNFNNILSNKHNLTSSQLNMLNKDLKYSTNNFILSEICSKNSLNDIKNSNNINLSNIVNSNSNKSDLICVICGASANGYNFDAITCESCKAFFRRNAFRPLNLFRCTNNNACEINIFTRKKCKKCRIMKCFKLGMRRDWIMSEREREEKRKKIEENRRKKVLDGSMSELQQPYSNLNMNEESQFNDEINNFMYSSGPKPIRRRRRRRKFSGVTNPTQTNSDNNNSNHINGSSEFQSSSKLSRMELFQKMGFTLPNTITSENIDNNFIKQNQFFNSVNNNYNSNNNSYYSSLKPSSSSNTTNSYQSLFNQIYSPSNQLNFSNNNSSINQTSTNIFNNLTTVAQNQNSNSLINSKLPKIYYESLTNDSNTQKKLASAKFLTNSILSNSNNINDFVKSNNGSTSQALSPSLNSYIDKLGGNNSLSPQSPFKVFESLNKSYKIENNVDCKKYDDSDELTDCDTPDCVDNNNNDSKNCKNNYYEQSKIHKFLSKQNKKRKQDQTKNDSSVDDSFKHLNDNTNLDDAENNSKINTPLDYSNKHSKIEQTNSEFNDFLLNYQSSNLFNLKMPLLSHEVIINTTSMNDIQRKQVTAISEAYKRAIQLVKAQGSPKNLEDINTTINLTELGVRRIIFFFKLISDFRSLDHDLMVKLLKQNMMSLLQIHGVNSYNQQDNTFKEPNTDDTPFSAESLVLVYGQEIYNFSISITRNLYVLCNNDMIYVKMLMLILIFDPMNDNLTDDEKKLISNLQNKYVTLIYAYMRENLGSPKSELTFKGMMYEVNKVNILANWFEKTVVEKSNYEYVRPLMKEIFSFPMGNTPLASNSSSPNNFSIKNSPHSVNEPKTAQPNCSLNNPNSYSEFNGKTPSTASSFVSDTPMSNNSNYI